jgi:hypothetical protein
MRADLAIFNEQDDESVINKNFSNSNPNGYWANISNLPNGTYEVVFDWYTNGEQPGGCFYENITISNPPKPTTYVNYVINNSILCFKIHDSKSDELITNMNASLVVFNEYYETHFIDKNFTDSNPNGYWVNISNLTDGIYEVAFNWYTNEEHSGGRFYENIIFNNPTKLVKRDRIRFTNNRVNKISFEKLSLTL